LLQPLARFLLHLPPRFTRSPAAEIPTRARRRARRSPLRHPRLPGASGAAPAGPAPQEEQTESISGWSVKDTIMGAAVYNENDEKIGDINDVVLSPEGKAGYFIVGAGGFLGVGSRDVAIPYDKITRNGEKFTLPGYTKEQLKALPRVEVAK
jgi:sporulation protein YlmC with PRC-barrel domain